MKKFLVVDDDSDVRTIAEVAGHIAKPDVVEATQFLERNSDEIAMVILDVIGVGELHPLINLCKDRSVNIFLTTGGSTAAAKYGGAIATNKNIQMHDKIKTLKMLRET